MVIQETSRCLSQYYRDGPNNNITQSESFKDFKDRQDYKNKNNYCCW